MHVRDMVKSENRCCEFKASSVASVGGRKIITSDRHLRAVSTVRTWIPVPFSLLVVEQHLEILHTLK